VKGLSTGPGPGENPPRKGLAPIRVTIGIITLRRQEGLRRLLSSLDALEFPGDLPYLDVLVVDNDDAGSAASVVEELCSTFGFPLRYVREPRRGISVARNRVFDCLATDTDFIAFIDDDEFAEPAWLAALLAAQRDHDADIVAGPVLAVFKTPPPAWKASFFRRRRMPTGTSITESGSGNVLIRKALLDRTGIRFREGAAFAGGEDTRLFMRLTALGARMIWSDEAVVHETVPASRTTLRWMIQRAFRGGTTWSACEREVRGSTWTLVNRVGRSIIRILQGLVMATLGVPFGREVVFRGVRHMATGAGNLAGLLGISPEEYKVIHGS
jgi:succinoglycan biosynthesis protein ExoM